MEIKISGRGFEFIEFLDRNGIGCSLQQSSAVGDYDFSFDKPGSSFVWLGVDEYRMHLDRKMVSELLNYLQTWLNTHTFSGKKK
jgi:hypothetical protein